MKHIHLTNIIPAHISSGIQSIFSLTLSFVFLFILAFARLACVLRREKQRDHSMALHGMPLATPKYSKKNSHPIQYIKNRYRAYIESE